MSAPTSTSLEAEKLLKPAPASAIISAYRYQMLPAVAAALQSKDEKIARLERTVKSQAEALETKGLSDAYRDGFAAAIASIKSIAIHETTKADLGLGDGPAGGWREPTRAEILETLEGGHKRLQQKDGGNGNV